MKIELIDEAWHQASRCELCGIRDLVLFADLTEDDFRLIHQPIADISFAAGDALYREGEAGDYVYTLRSGLIKLVIYHSDGRYRIVRLLRRGDLAGIEVLNGAPYRHCAEVLEPVEVCRIPVGEIERINQQSPRLHRQLIQRWQRIGEEADYWLSELATGPAQRRVGNLLLHLCEGNGSGDFYLPSREDIGAMLGITTETASRMVSSLRSEKGLRLLGQHRASIDESRLRAILGVL